ACCATTSRCATSAAPSRAAPRPGARPSTSRSRSSSSLVRSAADAGRAQGEANDRLELGDGGVGIDDLDGGHAHGARGLQVAADVVEEDGLGGLDRELVARQPVEARVGLAYADLARLDDEVEEVGEQTLVGRAVTLVARHPVVRQARGLQVLVAAAHSL